MSIKKELKLALKYLRIRFLSIYEYRLSFFLVFLTFAAETFFYIVFWKVIFLRTHAIGGWKFEDLIMLNLFAQIFYIFTDGFLHSFMELPLLIEIGELDQIFTKPMSSFVNVMFKRTYPIGMLAGITNFFIFLCILIFYFKVEITLLGMLFALVVSFIGCIIFSCFVIMVSTLAFWTTKVEFLEEIIWRIGTFLNYPLTAFPSLARMIFTFFIPIIFTATIPVLIVKNPSSMISLVFYELVFAGILVLLTACLWKRGVKAYESAFG